MSVLNILTYIIISITTRPIGLTAIIAIMSILTFITMCMISTVNKPPHVNDLKTIDFLEEEKDTIVWWLLTYIGIPLGDKFPNYIIWLSDYRMGWLTRLKVKALFQDENLTTLSKIFNIIVAYDTFDITLCNFIIKYNATFLPYLQTLILSIVIKMSGILR